MSTLGSSPHASACAACARPISPPPGQTAALFDMFCDLKGATRTPSRAKARHRAVTTGRMRLNKQAGTIEVNDSLTLSGIPELAFRDALGVRSSLDVIVAHYL